jgi:hypothetical protein
MSSRHATFLMTTMRNGHGRARANGVARKDREVAWTRTEPFSICISFLC